MRQQVHCPGQTEVPAVIRTGCGPVFAAAQTGSRGRVLRRNWAHSRRQIHNLVDKTVGYLGRAGDYTNEHISKLPLIRSHRCTYPEGAS
jgi:hypothetical protein